MGILSVATSELTESALKPSYSLNLGNCSQAGFRYRLEIFRDELSVTVDFYKENRKQILLNRTNSLPGFAGFQETPYGNVGKTRTKGYDLSLEYFKQFNKDLALTVRGNFTYTDVVWVDDDTPDKKFPWRNREGHSLKALEALPPTDYIRNRISTP